MRVFNYLIIIMVMITLFNIAGIETVSGKILTAMDVLGNPEGFSLTDFFTNSLNIVAAIAVVGTIAIGLYLRSSPESFLLVGYTATLFLFVADIIGIITHMNTYSNAPWISSVVALLLGPFAIGYVHSILSWWGNKAGG